MMGGVGKALAIIITAAALTLAGCSSGGTGVAGGAATGPRAAAAASGSAAASATESSTAAAGGADWRQIRDYYAAEFRPSCTDVSGSAQGKCIGTLGKAAQSLLDLVEQLPDGPAASALRQDAQAIVDDAQAFHDQSCRAGAAGGCGAIPADVTANAQSIERTLADAAG